jgi:hypothetical protein
LDAGKGGSVRRRWAGVEGDSVMRLSASSLLTAWFNH